MKKIYENDGKVNKTEKYDFSSVFEGCLLNPGLILCYVLYRHPEYEIDTLNVYSKSENDDLYTGRQLTGPFESLTSFLNIYDDNSFGRFAMNVSYKGNDITITGSDNSREIEVEYPKERILNLSPVFAEAEIMIGELLITAESHVGRMTKRGIEYKQPHLTKLQGYENAEEDGRLLNLPCKPGDTVYTVRGTGKSTGHFGTYPMQMKTLAQIVGYMEKGVFGDKVFVSLTQAQEKADQLTIRNKRRLKRYQKKNKELHI